MTPEGGPWQTDTKVDLTNCDREPIHLLGNVQSYGCLISTSADLMINHMSENCGQLLGLQPDASAGQNLRDLLSPQATHDLRAKLQVCSASGTVARLFAYDVLGNGKLFDVSVHLSGSSYVFEFEPKTDEGDRDDLQMVQPLIARVSRQPTVQKAVEEAARAMQVMAGFDRTMVYRFLPDDSGEVVAERCGPSMEPFLGLRYPASDIPKQARALYRRSLMRLIADVDDPGAAIVPEHDPNGDPLDLSMAVTRAVSPIHLQYLRNMGVAASMSVSILKDGALWGLFACHHNTPRYLDYERRSAIELFAQFFSYELERKIDAETRDQERNSRALHDRLMVRLSAGGDLVENFDLIAEEFGQIIPCDGVAVFSNGKYAAEGSVPSLEEFGALSRFLNTAPSGQIFASDSIAGKFPAAENMRDRVAGVMAIPISRTPRDYLLFFRREMSGQITWAGNPEKPVTAGEYGIRLTPRKSFEAYVEQVTDRSEPWSATDLRVGEALRVSLIEIVLKLTDDASLERQAAADKQELLIAELNHRVRNILNLIQGLVSQSKAEAKDIATYTQVLDGRIQALARAHDQLTEHAWTPTSLRELIAVEVNAFLSGQRDRFIVSGDVPLLAPEAFSVMALVLHEMVTNSAKYGALTDQSGRVEVSLTIAPDGALLIKWRDIGGPPVMAPTRKGFGTTIIERTVPFELKGTVETRYKVTGYEADIMIPGKYVSEGQLADATSEAEEPVAPSETVELEGTCLVLEDNVVIALDASDILSDAGASDVHMASSVDDALALIERHDIQFALLDVNLGNHTSLPVAEVLTARGVPFALATGYGGVDAIIEGYPPAVVVKKPFNRTSLHAAVREVLSAHQSASG